MGQGATSPATILCSVNIVPWDDAASIADGQSFLNLSLAAFGEYPHDLHANALCKIREQNTLFYLVIRC